MTLIKVCGITNIQDAMEAVNMGADFLGYIFADSPRKADIATVMQVQSAIAGRVKTVGVFTAESDEVFKIIDNCKLDYVQLHGGQSEEFAERIGADKVIRVLRVKDAGSLDLLSDYKAAAYYLLDTYKKGISGGTGETFNWDLAIKAKEYGKPVFLSGGLTPDNIAEAIRMVQPFAVDVSSGVELCPGKKDYSKMKELIDHVREADIASR